MNTDDPHLKCHLMSQIILHISPRHHVVVLKLRCRRSCRNANKNLRNYCRVGFQAKRLSSNAFVCFSVYAQRLLRDGVPPKLRFVAVACRARHRRLRFLRATDHGENRGAIQLVPQATSLRGTARGLPSHTSWRTSCRCSASSWSRLWPVSATDRGELVPPQATYHGFTRGERSACADPLGATCGHSSTTAHGEHRDRWSTTPQTTPEILSPTPSTAPVIAAATTTEISSTMASTAPVISSTTQSTTPVISSTTLSTTPFIFVDNAVGDA